MTLHIEGRRWFERTNGNTYHSVRIFKDGEQIATLPFRYGYDDQYIETALEWLHAEEIINRGEQRENGTWPTSGTFGLREHLGATHSVIDVSRKRDL